MLAAAPASTRPVSCQSVDIISFHNMKLRIADNITCPSLAGQSPRPLCPLLLSEHRPVGLAPMGASRRLKRTTPSTNEHQAQGCVESSPSARDAAMVPALVVGPGAPLRGPQPAGFKVIEPPSTRSLPDRPASREGPTRPRAVSGPSGREDNRRATARSRESPRRRT